MKRLLVLAALLATVHVQAGQIDDSGVKGGLAIVIGCDDTKLIEELGQNERFLVQALDSEPAKVEKAREAIRKSGHYGRATAALFDGKTLPYADNLVNLIVVAGDGFSGTDEELFRALAPRGVAVFVNRQSSEVNRKLAKPVPDDIDEWTHFLHDASNNAVADDRVAGPPRHYQWVAGPRWARSHDHLSTTSAMVSTGGRLFYILDEGATASVALPPKWVLIARDAFSGVQLWKRSMGSWEGHLRNFRSGPPDIARRLVAVDNRVYVTLGYGQPVTAIDAATGQDVRTYPETGNAMEILHHDGMLFVIAGDRAPDNTDGKAIPRNPKKIWHWWPIYGEEPPQKRLIALNADSGERLWKKDGPEVACLMPTAVAVAGKRLFLQTPTELVALDAGSGKELWRAPRPVNRRRPSWSAPTLVIHDGVVLSADRKVDAPLPGTESSRASVQWVVDSTGGIAPVGQILAFSAETGKKLWEAPCKEVYNAPVDILVADGLVWTGDLVRKGEPGITKGLDLHTGEVKRTRKKDQDHFRIVMSHHRCYRNKATTKYLVLGRDGIEYIDVKTGKGLGHAWVRGACQYGVMPCNGLTYAPPHSCACHIESKLDSFNALAPERKVGQKAESGPRLIKGPAFGKIDKTPNEATDWPTYRHDVARSGVASSPVPAKLAKGWETQLGKGNISSPVIAGGHVFVSCIDAHLVCALNAKDGKRHWSFTAGGRVDSPPTIHEGTALFGCADGWIYCLRVSDGALAWKYRAAPEERRIVSYEQLESPWPVPGNVLVVNGEVHAVAGRTPFLDGGMVLVRLNASTGEKLSETPVTGGALPDVLSSDGSSVFLRHRRFDVKGVEQKGAVPHLYSPAGFLDGNWWHRTYWIVGTVMGSNWGGWPNSGLRVPAGRLLAKDGTQIYGYGRLDQYHRDGAHVGLGKRKYLLYACNLGTAAPKPKAPKGKKAAPRKPNVQWSNRIGVLARAMVLSGETLFVAGPPDLFVVAPEGADHPYHITSEKVLMDQDAALAGKRGAALWVISTKDGSKLGEVKLPAAPAWDGMAAAGGKLYLSTTDGRAICLHGAK